MILRSNTPIKALQAFATLRNNPAFIAVMDYLKEELDLSDENLRKANDTHLIGKYQGCSLTLSDLIQKAQQASERLKTIENV